MIELFTQDFGHHPVNQNQAAGHMEGTLKGAALAGGLGGLAVPAQATVPFAVLVCKVLLTVVQDLVEGIQVLLILGVAVDHHGSDQ